MAKGWKRAVERMLSGSGLARLAERRRRPTLVILAYHNIVPAGEGLVGDVSLHVDQRTFAEQLDWLLERRTVVPLEAALAEHREGPALPAEPTRVAVTFDDAYRGTMSAGLEELKKRGLPGTVFVPPGLLGSDGFWWDRLAPVGGRPLDPRVREHVLVSLRGRTSEIVEWAHAEGLPLQELPAHARPVTEVELLDAARTPGLTLGAHTWTHPNLGRLDGAELTHELSRPKEWLEARTDRYVNSLAYPYGLTSESAEVEAAELFDGALLVSGGAAVIRGEWVGAPARIPRVNVPRGLSLDGLALRLAGIVG